MKSYWKNIVFAWKIRACIVLVTDVYSSWKRRRRSPCHGNAQSGINHGAKHGGNSILTPTQKFISRQYEEHYMQKHPRLDETGEFELINSFHPSKCSFCGSEKFFKYGHTRIGVQRYLCSEQGCCTIWSSGFSTNIVGLREARYRHTWTCMLLSSILHVISWKRWTFCWIWFFKIPNCWGIETGSPKIGGSQVKLPTLCKHGFFAWKKYCPLISEGTPTNEEAQRLKIRISTFFLT